MINFDQIRDQLNPGLGRWLGATPEERKKIVHEADELRIKAMAEESSRYNALTPAERVDYDRLTVGMMPRVW